MELKKCASGAYRSNYIVSINLMQSVNVILVWFQITSYVLNCCFLTRRTPAAGRHAWFLKIDPVQIVGLHGQVYIR